MQRIGNTSRCWLKRCLCEIRVWYCLKVSIRLGHDRFCEFRVSRRCGKSIIRDAKVAQNNPGVGYNFLEF